MKLIKDMTQKEIGDLYTSLAIDINQSLPPDVNGFIVITLSDDNLGHSFTNLADRGDVIRELRLLADKFEFGDTVDME